MFFFKLVSQGKTFGMMDLYQSGIEELQFILNQESMDQNKWEFIMSTCFDSYDTGQFKV